MDDYDADRKSDRKSDALDAEKAQVHVTPAAELDHGTALILDHAAERALCRFVGVR